MRRVAFEFSIGAAKCRGCEVDSGREMLRTLEVRAIEGRRHSLLEACDARRLNEADIVSPLARWLTMEGRVRDWGTNVMLLSRRSIKTSSVAQASMTARLSFILIGESAASSDIRALNRRPRTFADFCFQAVQCKLSHL